VPVLLEGVHGCRDCQHRQKGVNFQPALTRDVGGRTGCISAMNVWRCAAISLPASQSRSRPSRFSASPRGKPSLVSTAVLASLPRVAQAGNQAEYTLAQYLRKARRLGASWAVIGQALGMARQSAWAPRSRSRVTRSSHRWPKRNRLLGAFWSLASRRVTADRPSIARRHQRRPLRTPSSSHRHDPLRSTTLSRGPSDHAGYTEFLTVPAPGNRLHL
jgi:hypothetical protein